MKFNKNILPFSLIFISTFIFNIIGKVSLFLGLISLIGTTKKIITNRLTLLLFAILIGFNVIHLFIFKKLDIAYLEILLYFLIIPGILQVKTLNQNNKTLIYKILKIIFKIIFILSIVRFFDKGLNFDMKNFFFLNKNTVSMTFELISLTLMVINPKNAKRIYFISILTSFLIGGKTAFLIITMFGLIILMGKKYGKKLLFIGGGVTIFLLIYLFNFIPSELLHTLDQRFVLWEQAFFEITNYNIYLGLGVDNFVSEYSSMGLLGKTAIHNYYLQYAHAFGLIGLIIFFSILFNSIRLLKKFNARIIIFAFSLHSMVDVGWVLGPGVIFSICYAILKTDE